MTSETIVYSCPYCPLSWFNTQHDLAYHIYKQHLRDFLLHHTEKQKRKVKKTRRKWGL